MRRRFVTLDVFTGQRFAGNPLAVVLDSDDLEGAAMQAVAREFNLSETVFVLPPRDPAHRARLRIFTPVLELPFAGHPTVGTVVLLARLDQIAGRRDLVVEEGIGPVRCSVERIDADCGQVRFVLPRLPAEVGPAPDAGRLAAALGLRPGDVGFEKFVPGRWSAGVPITFVPVGGLAAVRGCRPDPGRWDAIDPPGAAFVFCRETVQPGRAFHARMFAPAVGVPEDPATGSAAAAFAGVLAQTGGVPDGERRFVIEQGFEMGRPSLIELDITLAAGQLLRAAIGGEAIVVAEGTIEA